MIAPEITPMGWLHSFACTVALIAGALQLIRPVGTAAHALRGNAYFWSMVVANVTALFVFQVDVVVRRGQEPLFGPYFGVFHWLAVVTLGIVLLGRFAATCQHRTFGAYAHPIAMILSYWLLVGGAINEAFARVEWVVEAARAVSPGATSLPQYTLLYWCHYANNALILLALVMSLVSVRRFRRRSPAVVSA